MLKQFLTIEMLIKKRSNLHLRKNLINLMDLMESLRIMLRNLKKNNQRLLKTPIWRKMKSLMKSCKRELISITISETKFWKLQMRLKLLSLLFIPRELSRAQVDGRSWMTIIKIKFQLMLMFQELWFTNQLNHNKHLEKSKQLMLLRVKHKQT